MKIGIDAFAAIGKGGNSTYSRELIKNLIMLDSPNRYDLFVYLHDLLRPMFRGSQAGKCAEVHVRLSPSYFPLPKLAHINEWLLRARASVRKVDIFHFTNPLNIIEGPFKRVVTVHDLAPLHDTSWTKKAAGEEFVSKLGSIAAADAIIAVSEFTKQDMVLRLQVPPGRITVIYEGAGSDFYRDDNKETVMAAVGAGPYVLCVGQLQPRKNNIALLSAFASIAPDFPDLTLVFVGRPVSAEYMVSLQNAVAEAGLDGRVVFLHAADNILLRRLYTRAECLIYPSLFEGFGLPVLESMQCGVPVITSNTSSLPEVAGEAGLLVDPRSHDDLAAAIKRYLSDEALRRRLRDAIPAQLAKFSWKKAAEETLKVYASLS